MDADEHLEKIINNLFNTLTGKDQIEPLAAFDSPIETELYRVITKYLHEDAVLENQTRINTPNGYFKLDFQVTIGDRKIALEANGKEFHAYDKDMLRGALILGFSDVSSIYYIRGCDITYSLESALWAISRNEKEMFSERGLLNLEKLSEITEKRGEMWNHSDALIGLAERSGYNHLHKVYDINYLIKDNDTKHWHELVEIARKHRGMKIDKLLGVIERIYEEKSSSLEIDPAFH